MSGAQVGTPFDWLFEALTRAMGVTHTTESSPSQRDRVVWSRSGAIKPERSPYQRSSEQTMGRLAHPWTATVYGASDLEVSQRLAQLWSHLDRLAGPPAGDYEVGQPGDSDYAPESPGYEFAPGKIELRGGDGTAMGYACDVAVTLRQTVGAYYTPAAAPVSRVEVEAAAVNSDDTTTTGAAITVAAA